MAEISTFTLDALEVHLKRATEPNRLLDFVLYCFLGTERGKAHRRIESDLIKSLAWMRETVDPYTANVADIQALALPFGVVVECQAQAGGILTAYAFDLENMDGEPVAARAATECLSLAAALVAFLRSPQGAGRLMDADMNIRTIRRIEYPGMAAKPADTANAAAA